MEELAPMILCPKVLEKVRVPQCALDLRAASSLYFMITSGGLYRALTVH